MFKKVLFVGLGVVLALGLLFGRQGWSYVCTTVGELRESVHANVPIDLKLKAARNEVKKLDPEIRDIMHKIAKEEVQIERLRGQVDKSERDLEKSYANIMILKKHLEEGSGAFVSHGRSFTNRQVEEDLRRRFESYTTKEETTENLRQIVQAREAQLEAAREKLTETMAAKRQLELEIENLEARQKMLEVAKISSGLKFDNSQLAHTRELIDDIKTRIEVEEKVVNVEPKNFGGAIPLDEPQSDGDILQEVNSYFGGKVNEYAGYDQ